MAAMHTRNWISFFQAAGIHDDVLAARYAAIFVENEIHTSMLMELDMELLRVMGISKVGHVLGILKHAKLVHDTQLFAASQPSPPSRSQSSGTSSPIIVVDTKGSAKKSRPTATSRIIERYVKQPETTEDSPARPVVVGSVGVSSKKSRSKVVERLGSATVTKEPQNNITARLGASSKKSKFNMTHRFGTESQAAYPVASGRQEVSPRTKVTDRLGTKSVTHVPKRREAITFRPEGVVEEIPTVKRVRRVLPEHEGGYSISMPSGSTPRSREILAKMTARQSITVFDRLGDASVSSTTEVEEPTITITGFETEIVKSGSSVFSRLGDKAETTSTVTQQPISRPATQGVKARLGNPMKFKGTSTVECPIKLESRFPSENNASREGRKQSSFRSETIPSSTTPSGEVQYVGILKKQGMFKMAPNLQSRIGVALPVQKSVANSTSMKTVAKRNSSAGILGNPTNATKLSAKARLDLSARDSSHTGLLPKRRKFIMTNRKTGERTIVYKMTNEDEPHINIMPVEATNARQAHSASGDY